MKGYRWMTWGIFLVFGLLVVGQSALAGDAKLEVVPAKTPLSPALIKKAPLEFKGAGFAPKEMILVEMIPPKGLKIKSLPEGDRVGLAVGAADGKGNFDIKMHPVSTLNWIFQVDWTPNMKPNLKKMSPLPPGKYEIEASGMQSGNVAKATFELLKPPTKKKK
jgi:hypothetical protein